MLDDLEQQVAGAIAALDDGPKKLEKQEKKEIKKPRKEEKPKEATRFFDDERYVKEVLEAPLPQVP